MKSHGLPGFKRFPLAELSYCAAAAAAAADAAARGSPWGIRLWLGCKGEGGGPWKGDVEMGKRLERLGDKAFLWISGSQQVALFWDSSGADNGRATGGAAERQGRCGR